MRDKLAQYYHETHCFTAKFQSYGRTPEERNVACLRNIFKGDEWMTDHLWVHRSQQMKRLELVEGDILQFEALVVRYARSESFSHVSEIQYDYALHKIRDLQVVWRAARNNP